MKPTTTNTDNINADTIADSRYPDLDNVSPRELHAKIQAYHDALMWETDPDARHYYNRQKDLLAILKIQIEERARNEGKT
jgi:hypothetical protein